MVLGIASTAMPFARTADEEAERWLRVLRLHGEVGAALQALGVSEDSLLAQCCRLADNCVRPAAFEFTESADRTNASRQVASKL